MNFKKQVRNDRNLTQEPRENSIASKKYASKFPLNNNLPKKNKIPRKTTFLNIKFHLKLKYKSVGQGRGGLEETGRPSQLRAGSLP